MLFRSVIRGPVTYCIEEVDNGTDLEALYLLPDTDFVVAEKEIAGHKVMALVGDGYRVQAQAMAEDLYFLANQEKREAVKVQLIPYYVWANRGENEMRAWIERGRR